MNQLKSPGPNYHKSSIPIRESRRYIATDSKTKTAKEKITMPAHLIWKDDNGKHGYYLADGYLVKSLKTKSKAHAEALLKQYIQGKYNLNPCPTVKEFY